MGSNAITDQQIQLRIYCIEQGFADKVSAKICKCKETTFCQWRRVRQNQEFSSTYIKPLNEAKNRYRKENKVVLTAEDVDKYHRNDNTPRLDNNNIILSMEIDTAEKVKNLLPPITSLINRVQARKIVQDQERNLYFPREENNNLEYLQRSSAGISGRYA